MKWLVLILLAINGFIWLAGDIWVPDSTNAVVTAQTLPRVSTLKVGETGSGRELISSVADAESNDGSGNRNSPARQPKSVDDAEPDPESGQVAVVPEVRTCVRLGWFETANSARKAYQDLGSPGAVYQVLEQERTLEPLHWVIIPPQPEDRALRLFNDLQRRGIDSYLVTRGENTNAISLGLFQSKDAAERVLETKKRQNLNAVLANFPRNQLSYALVFEVSQASDTYAGDGRASDYQDDFDMVEISRCEGIATSPENP